MRSSWLIAALLAGCNNAPNYIGGGGDLSGSYTTDGGGGSPDLGRGHTVVLIGQNSRTKLDLLFMIDNSNSMDAMQTELRARFPSLVQVLRDLAAQGVAADLDLGVVTSDYGAGATGAPGCTPSPGGQFGKLQAVGQFAPMSCQPPVGANFVHYNFANGGVDNNLPAGQDLATTFGCMASVGSAGCGFEHQLESVYAALHNGLIENQGFVRPDAALAVVFVTNEDDASAPPDTDVFDKSKDAQYGYLDSYSRQTRFAIVCGNPPMFPPYGDSGGPLAFCQGAPNLPTGAGPGKQYDVSRYINLFTKPAAQGGVKANPLDVVLVAIDGPDSFFQVILSNPGTPAGQPYTQCPQLNETMSPVCVPVLQHSCMNAANPGFFGDPAVRLNQVLNAATNHAVYSICDNDFTPAMQSIGQLISSQVGAGCVTDRLPDPTHPDCTAQDVTQNADGTTTVTQIPACSANQGFPCWRIEQKAACATLSPDGVGVTIDRNGQSAPPNTTTQVICAT
jgi:hypothetical protein